MSEISQNKFSKIEEKIYKKLLKFFVVYFFHVLQSIILIIVPISFTFLLFYITRSVASYLFKSVALPVWLAWFHIFKHVTLPMILGHRIKEDTYIEIKGHQCPIIFSIVKDIADKTEQEMPIHIYLTTEINAAVFSSNASIWSLFTKGRKNLVIGIGLLHILNNDELKAVISHEYGHFSQKGTNLSAVLYRLYNICNKQKSAIIDNSWLNYTNKKWYNSIQYAFTEYVTNHLCSIFVDIENDYLKLSRNMEQQADLIACNITGTDAMISALCKINLMKNAKKEYDGLVTSLIKRNVSYDYWEGFDYYINKQHYRIVQPSTMLNETDLKEINQSRITDMRINTTHPSIEERLSNIATSSIHKKMTDCSNITQIIPQSIQNKVAQVYTESLISNISSEHERTSHCMTCSTNGFERICNDYIKQNYNSFIKNIFVEDTRVPFKPEFHIDKKQQLVSPFTEENKKILKKWNIALKDYDTIKDIMSNRIDCVQLKYNGIIYTKAEMQTIETLHKTYMKTLYSNIESINIQIYKYICYKFKHDTKIRQIYKSRYIISCKLKELERISDKAKELAGIEKLYEKNKKNSYIKLSTKNDLLEQLYSCINDIDLLSLNVNPELEIDDHKIDYELCRLNYFLDNKIEYGLDAYNIIIMAYRTFLCIQNDTKEIFSEYINCAINNISISNKNDSKEYIDIWDTDICNETIREKTRETIAKYIITGKSSYINDIFGDSPSQLQKDEYDKFNRRLLGYNIIFANKNEFEIYLNRNKDTNDVNIFKNIAYQYIFGDIVEKDYAEALKWFRKCAELNDSEAMCRIGEAYLYGYGVEKDYIKAIQCLKKSILEDAFDDALLTLGICYLNGNGVPKNYEHAYTLIERSAKLGNPEAMYKLSRLYLYAIGTCYNVADAFMWCRYAAENGCYDAQLFLEDYFSECQGNKTAMLRKLLKHIAPTIIHESMSEHGSCLIIHPNKDEIVLYSEDIWKYNWTFDKNDSIEYIFKNIYNGAKEMIENYLKSDYSDNL